MTMFDSDEMCMMKKRRCMKAATRIGYFKCC